MKSIESQLLEPSGYYLQVKEWHRQACPDNDCASALLAFLLFFHKHKQTMKEYARLTNEMLRKKGKPAVADETDWQYHTDEMLIRKLFYWKEDTIRKAINYLRDKGFIETNAPAYLQSLYKTGRTKWFRVIIPAIQKWIMDNYPLIKEDLEAVPAGALVPMERKYKKADQYQAIAKRLFAFRQRLHEEEESTPPKPQLNKITARLKENIDEIDLAFAVIGNLESPWHRGENPNSEGSNKMTYQLIRHIFKDSDKVIYFKQIAQNNGWTRSKVIDEYERIMNISYESRSSTEIAESNLTPERKIEIDRIYRETAKVLTDLVIVQRLKMDDILKRFYDESAELNFSLIDLSDPDRLGREIIDTLAQTEIVSEDRKDRINTFAQRFILKLRGTDA